MIPSSEVLGAALQANGLAEWQGPLDRAIDSVRTQPHGRTAEWNAALAALPDITTRDVTFSEACIEVGRASELSDAGHFEATLKTFQPWRKGPFRLFGVKIDTEWRSDWKWQRIAPHLSPLAGRRVLDVGCGNGYYMLRALGEGARFALGVDPTLVFLYQFSAVTRFAGDVPALILPIKGEDLPPTGSFDTVFSLGVLYHRRSPLDHLAELHAQLRPGGELVLETLVIEGDEQEILMPEDRYAQMRNVWFLPSPAGLELWLSRLGFEDVRTVDVARTTTAEQRATAWMTFQSLADFLDPDNPALTIEGYPAPTRATVLARRPGC